MPSLHISRLKVSIYSLSLKHCRDEEGIQHPNLPAWCDELPVDYFINPFYGISRDRVDAFLQEMLDREEEEYEAGWREVPNRNRERRRKPQEYPKPSETRQHLLYIDESEQRQDRKGKGLRHW
jgi:hypothetical protein